MPVQWPPFATMNDLTLSFVGQCHTVGYPGVPPDAAFPQVCRAALQARRPDAHVTVVLEEYQHPQELDRAVTRALRARPRVVVIEVVGWLAVKGTESIDLTRLPRGVRSAYQRVRYFRQMTNAIAAKLPRAAELIHDAATAAGALVAHVGPRHTRTTPSEYEHHLGRAVAAGREVPGVDCVIQGPGAPNLELDSRHFPSDLLERYRAVQQMARRVAETHGVLYVDRWDTIAPGFFSSDSIRPSAQGHSTWGHLLADKLVESGLV